MSDAKNQKDEMKNKRSPWWRRIFGQGRQRGDAPSPPVSEETPVFSNLESEGAIFTTGSTLDVDTAEQEAGFASAVWQLGREDASLGQPKVHAEKVLVSKSELDWIERRARAHRAIQTREGEIILETANREELQRQVEALRLRRWQLTAHPLLPPDRRPAIMAVSYIFIGLLAFAAEFPLSVNLVSFGLRMRSDQLAEWGVLSTPALALVLCLFGVAVKIFVDGRVLNASLPPPENPAAARKSVRARRIFLLVEVILMILCIATIGNIARLRAITDGLSRLEKTAGDAGSEASNDLRLAVDVARKQRQESADRTLLLLTITLPLFGAVSLITGATRLRQNAEDQDAYRALRAAEDKLASCATKLGDLRQAVASAKQQDVDEINSTTIKESVLATRLTVYAHGYARGKVLPEDRPADTKFYDLHVQALKRLANRNIRSQYAIGSKEEPS